MLKFAIFFLISASFQFVDVKCGIFSPSPEDLVGSWTVRNATDNAKVFLGDCPKIVIRENKNDPKNLDVFVKSSGETHQLILQTINPRRFEVYLKAPRGANIRLGTLTIVHLEKNHFFILQLARGDEVLYAVLTNDENPDLPEKTLTKVWYDSSLTQNIPLKPVIQSHCDKDDSRSEENETPIIVVIDEKLTTLTIHENVANITTNNTEKPEVQHNGQNEGGKGPKNLNTERPTLRTPNPNTEISTVTPTTARGRIRIIVANTTSKPNGAAGFMFNYNSCFQLVVTVLICTLAII